MKKYRIIEDAIKESMSGIISEYRTRARADGLPDKIFVVRCPIDKLLDRVNSRLIGMDEKTISTEDLNHYLSELEVQVINHIVELKVVVPAPRSAHARPPRLKKYRIINLATNAEWEADTSSEVWDIIGKEIPLFGIYEVRDNLTNQIVPEFIPL